jgi:hypothetical protein
MGSKELTEELFMLTQMDEKVHWKIESQRSRIASYVEQRIDELLPPTPKK